MGKKCRTLVRELQKIFRLKYDLCTKREREKQQQRINKYNDKRKDQYPKITLLVPDQFLLHTNSSNPNIYYLCITRENTSLFNNILNSVEPGL